MMTFPLVISEVLPVNQGKLVVISHEVRGKKYVNSGTTSLIVILGLKGVSAV
jgi:hypothetical protein